MPSFYAVNYSNCVNRERERERERSLITVFPQLLKIIAKKPETFESEKGKTVSSNFQKRFNFKGKL